MGILGGTGGKELLANAGDSKRGGFDPWVGKIPWRGAWQPTLVFVPGDLTDRGAWRARVHRVHSSVGSYSSQNHIVGHNWSDVPYTHANT